MDNKDYIFVKCDGIINRVSYKDISHIIAAKDYCTVCTENRNYHIHFTIKALARVLPKNIFCRCHRSHIVNIDRIDTIKDNVVCIGQSRIIIGKQYKQWLIKRINCIN